MTGLGPRIRWISFDKKLPEKPEIGQIARTLGIGQAIRSSREIAYLLRPGRPAHPAAPPPATCQQSDVEHVTAFSFARMILLCRPGPPSLADRTPRREAESFGVNYSHRPNPAAEKKRLPAGPRCTGNRTP